MARRGRHITIPALYRNDQGKMNIPTVEEFNNSQTRYCKINQGYFTGRPKNVLCKLIRFCIEKEWIDAKNLYKALIWFGFDENYINEVTIAKIALEYRIKDKNWTKPENLEKVEQDAN